MELHEEYPVLWQTFLVIGIETLWQNIRNKHANIKPKTLAFMKASLCTKSWAIYRVIRPEQVSGECYSQWSKMFGLFQQKNETLWLNTQAELLLLQSLQILTNMIFQTCQTLKENSSTAEDDAETCEVKCNDKMQPTNIAPIFKPVTKKQKTRHFIKSTTSDFELAPIFRIVDKK